MRNSRNVHMRIWIAKGRTNRAISEKVWLLKKILIICIGSRALDKVRKAIVGKGNVNLEDLKQMDGEVF